MFANLQHVDKATRRIQRAARRERPAGLLELTPRQADVVCVRCSGYTNSETAERLFITSQTVKNHITAALQKSGFGTMDGLCFWLGQRSVLAEERARMRTDLAAELADKAAAADNILLWLRSRKAEYERVLGRSDNA